MPLYDNAKVDNVSTLGADEYNQYAGGHNALVTSSGQTPTTGTPEQYGKAVAQYAADGDYYLDSGSAVDAYVAVVHDAREGLVELVAGTQIRFIPLAANTTADPTINVNGLGAIVIKASDGTDLSAGDMAVGDIATLFFDGTNFRLQKPVTAGLPFGYINDTVTYETVTTIDWSGSARSEDDTTDLVVPSGAPITATLSGSPINTQQYLFVGLDAGLAIKAEFTTDITGVTGLSVITGPKRRIGDDKDVSFPTDVSGDLVSFERIFGDWEFIAFTGGATGTLTLDTPLSNYRTIVFEYGSGANDGILNMPMSMFLLKDVASVVTGSISTTSATREMRSYFLTDTTINFAVTGVALRQIKVIV